MLVLTRKLNQAILIGDDVRVVIVSIDRDQVRIGIEAPKAVPVHRAEIRRDDAASAAAAIDPSDAP